MSNEQLKQLDIPIQDKLYLLGLVHQVVEPHQLPDDFILKYMQKGFIKRDYISDRLEIDFSVKEITVSDELVKRIRKYYQDRCLRQGWNGDNSTIKSRLTLFFKTYGEISEEKILQAIDNYFDETSAKYIKKLENFILNIDPLSKSFSSTLMSHIDGLHQDDIGSYREEYCST